MKLLEIESKAVVKQQPFRLLDTTTTDIFLALHCEVSGYLTNFDESSLAGLNMIKVGIKLMEQR